MGSGRFEGDRKAAWTGLLTSQARTMKRLGQELDDAGKIPLNTYDVLVQLTEAGGRLRLRDLVDRVLLSQPGLSRKVARMEDEGLVERLPDPTDGRGVLVRMTRSGRAALRSAAIVHIAGIEREFTSRISDEEAATLARVFARLSEAEHGSDGQADTDHPDVEFVHVVGPAVFSNGPPDRPVPTHPAAPSAEATRSEPTRSGPTRRPRSGGSRSAHRSRPLKSGPDSATDVGICVTVSGQALDTW